MEVLTDWSTRFDSFSSKLQVASDLIGQVYLLEYEADDLIVNNAWLIQYTSAGEKVWQKPLTAAFHANSVAMACDPTGTLYLAGSTDTQACLCRFDQGGEVVWAEKWETEEAHPIHQLSCLLSGQICVGGWTAANEIWLNRYTPEGELLDNQIWELDDVAEVWAIAFSETGDLYISGMSNRGDQDQLTNSLQNAWLARYTQNGDEVWRQFWGSASWDKAFALCCSPTNKIYIAGTTEGEMGADLAQGGSDAWLAQYNAEGDEVWVDQWGSLATDSLSTICCDWAGNIYVAGKTAGQMGDFPDQVGIEAWVAKYRHDGRAVWLKQWGNHQFNETDGLACDAQANLLWVGRSVEIEGDDETAWVTKFCNEPKTVADLTQLVRDQSLMQATFLQNGRKL